MLQVHSEVKQPENISEFHCNFKLGDHVRYFILFWGSHNLLDQRESDGKVAHLGK